VTRVKRTVAKTPFECAVVLVGLLYAALHLSPSSYALALHQLGENVAPLAGDPQIARSDEWAVGTPLFQAAVANHFHAVNNTSFYSESLLTTGALPIWNWGIALKPQLWGFAVFSPSLAYSIFWAVLACAMLIGWSLLLRRVGFSPTIAAASSTLLFFSPFVQTWWTGIGPQLAFFPWIVLLALAIRSVVLCAAALAVAVPVWLIAQFYVPGVPGLVYLALALVLIFEPGLFRTRTVIAWLAGLLVGIAVTWAYFRPVIDEFANSVYPGHRWYDGGGLSLPQIVSQLLPSTTTEGHQSLLAMNISEVSTVCSWLPLLTLMLVDFRTVRHTLLGRSTMRRDVMRVCALLVAFLLLTLWQWTPWARPMGYVFGLGLGPEQRTLFASGTLLLLASAYTLDRLPLKVTLLRLAVFATAVVAAWALASRRYPGDLVVWDELVVLVPIVFVAPLLWYLSGRPGQPGQRHTIVLVALVPAIWGWALFNPVQSTDVMFRKPDTPVTRELDALARRRSDHAIAVQGFQGAILNGVGYKSVTHVMSVPNPHVFRRFFPLMPQPRLNWLFNRYARIGLTDARQPELFQADTVLLPKARMSRFAATH
jgi:hypothetical protein